jgi:hypothetical protein
VLGLADGTAVDALSVAGRLDGTQRWVTLAPRVRVDTLAASPAGRAIPLAWPAGTTVVDQLRIELVRANASGTLRIDHVALYPRDEPPR